MKKFLLLYFFIGLNFAGFSQVSKDSELFIQLKKMDSLIFEESFNKCHHEAIEPHISEDLEFYHDQGGLSTTKKQFFDAVKKNICSNPNKKPIRKLREESLKVFPLYNNGQLYGAIQQGVHDFYIKEPNKEMYLTSSAKFTHVWLLEDNEWILKRVLSYDHHSPEQSR